MCKWLYQNDSDWKWYKLDSKTKKKEFAKKKNKMRRWMHKRRIKKLRVRDPLKTEYPLKLNVWSYSD